MKKFSYAEEFSRVADVVRLGDANDVRISYAVFVGDPNDDDEGFLGTGCISADDFTTWSDAAKAKVFVQTILETVDGHQKNTRTAKELPRNLRHEIYQCIDSTIEKMIEYRDDDLFGAMLTAELTYGINNVLAKHNAN